MMSYTKQLDFKRRRHPVQRLTPDQAIDRLNAIVDDANAQIARAVAAMQHWENVAAAMVAENNELRSANAEMIRQISELEIEVSNLNKRLRKKAGRRRNEWLGDNE